MDKPLDFLVPDYMPTFRCKMGACRTACCVGWPVTVSMKDYFRLLGEECSTELRRRIDCALHLHPRPTQDEYAQILPRWDGDCSLRLPDGRCALQAELGEEALAAVCRLYPRGVRRDEKGYECSCANSCEAVAELLCREEPLHFHQAALNVIPPADQPRLHTFESAGREKEIRLWLISLMQDRRYPLGQRLLRLGSALHAMEEALHAHDMEQVNLLLAGKGEYAIPEAPAPDHQALLFGLDAVEKMLALLDRRSNSIRSYGETILAHFGQGEEAFLRYEAAAAHFAAVMPLWERWMENLLVNHMFFVRFPYQDRPVSLKDEFTALCAVYILLRFLCVGWMADKDDLSAAMDAAAALFRLVEHAEFDQYAGPILHGLGCDDWAHLAALLSL